MKLRGLQSATRATTDLSDRTTPIVLAHVVEASQRYGQVSRDVTGCLTGPALRANTYATGCERYFLDSLIFKIFNGTFKQLVELF
ncbi:hypothetical protein PM082_024243 [Marasmius tenuissimus]|nr:hypothetical protein PM082_024243 [Marasmius tenuissimus]